MRLRSARLHRRRRWRHRRPVFAQRRPLPRVPLPVLLVAALLTVAALALQGTRGSRRLRARSRRSGRSSRPTRSTATEVDDRHGRGRGSVPSGASPPAPPTSRWPHRRTAGAARDRGRDGRAGPRARRRRHRPRPRRLLRDHRGRHRTARRRLRRRDHDRCADHRGSDHERRSRRRRRARGLRAARRVHGRLLRDRRHDLLGRADRTRCRRCRPEGHPAAHPNLWVEGIGYRTALDIGGGDQGQHPRPLDDVAGLQEVRQAATQRLPSRADASGRVGGVRPGS